MDVTVTALPVRIDCVVVSTVVVTGSVDAFVSKIYSVRER